MRVWIKLLVDDGKGVRGKNPREIFQHIIRKVRRDNSYKVIESRSDFAVAMTSGEDPYAEDPETDSRKGTR